MRTLSLASAALLVTVLTATPVSAVTVDQIVALSKAGVSESVILALIDRDQTILTIQPDQILAFKRDGVSDAVIMAMLKSGRQQSEQALQAQAASNAASVAQGPWKAPDLFIIGHGPDRPNTGEPMYHPGFVDAFAAPNFAYIPYLPYVIPAVRTGFPRGAPPTSFMAVPPDTSPRGMFFSDSGAPPARGTFFSKH